MSIPVPATAHATTAPVCPKVRGNEKAPAPAIEPATMPVSIVNGSRLVAGASVVVMAARSFRLRGRCAS